MLYTTDATPWYKRCAFGDTIELQVSSSSLQFQETDKPPRTFNGAPKAMRRYFTCVCDPKDPDEICTKAAEGH